MPEQQNIEYKQSWHDDYLKWVCGFANAIGGMIYIGLDDNGNAAHLADYAKLLEDIPNKIRNSMGIICDVQLEDKQGKKYISIKVNPYSVAVSLRGRFYYRTGSTNLELTGTELNEFLLKKAGKTWDDVVEEGATVKDIDEASIARFIADSNEKGRMPETKGLSTFQILEKLKLTESRKLKRAGIVLFGKEPNRFYPNVQVKIGRFGLDSTDLRFQEVVEGNLVHMLDEVLLQLNHKFLIRPVVFAGMQRVEKNEYPIVALREMLLNALVHRTYMGAHVQLRVYDDRLSIWNEGGLPIGLSLADLKVEHNSRPRNPKIADACFLAGYIDTWGRGTLKIINACIEAGLPEPEIKEMNGGIEVTIYSQIINDAIGGAIGGAIEKNDRSISGSIDKKGGSIGGSINKKGGSIGGSINLTSRQEQILFMIEKDNKISYRTLASKMQINDSAVKKHLKALKNKGIIERIGGTRGYWQISTLKDNL